jgi:hypothetical protein
MTKATTPALLSALLWLALATCARAEITVDEARVIAESRAGHSLASAIVHQSELASEPRVEFVEGTDPATRCTWSVRLRDGAYTGYTRNSAHSAPDTAPMTQDEALAMAQDQAAQEFGAEAGAMRWRVQTETPTALTFYGVGPDMGDPPRGGLAPGCEVTVLPSKRTIAAFLVFRPIERAPLPVTITKDQAVATARRALAECTGRPEDTPLAEEPGLGQHRDVVSWSVRFVPAGGEWSTDWLCQVDAQSGKVIMTSDTRDWAPASSPTAATPPTSAPAASPPAAARTRQWSWPYLAGAGVLALLAGVVIVARRRRR